jgi:hypothetical protein
MNITMRTLIHYLPLNQGDPEEIKDVTEVSD